MNNYLSSPLLANISYIRHGFLTRPWGVPYDNALNAQKLKDIAFMLGIDEKNLLTLKQVHSNEVVLANKPFEHSPKADALICENKGLVIAVLSADCVPILLADIHKPMVAAIHAGWRGALGGIIENTVDIMQKRGATHIIAALGACIWQESYEVSDDFYDAVKEKSFFIKNRKGHWLFDLPGFVRARLANLSVKLIDGPVANTYGHKDFYSYRYENSHLLKSNISFIGIL
jgi:YfiH family protein